MSENTENTGRDALLMEKHKSLLPLKKLKENTSPGPGNLDLLIGYTVLDSNLNYQVKVFFCLKSFISSIRSLNVEE